MLRTERSDLAANPKMASAPSLTPTIDIEQRAWKAKLIAGALLGLFLGAALGSLTFGFLSSDSTATAFIRINPPVDFSAIAGGADQTTPVAQDMTENYVAGEVSYLSGEGFAEALGRKLALSEPASIVVAQAGGSSAVTISNSSPTADEARRTVQTAIDIYGQQLAQRVDQQMRAILPALDQWQRDNAADPQRTAQVAALREAIGLQAAQASVLIVLQPPTVSDPRLSRWLIGVLLGGVLGATIAVLAVMRRSRQAGQPNLVTGVAAAADGVLVPAVNIRTPWNPERPALARMLYTQCIPAEPDQIIVVLGATEDSGTSVIATMLEFAAGEEETVPSAAAADRRATQVIDAGTIGASASALHAINQATTLVVVARIDHDAADQVLVTCSAVSARGVPVLAAFTYRPWWDSWLTELRDIWPFSRRTSGRRHGAGGGVPP